MTYSDGKVGKRVFYLHNIANEVEILLYQVLCSHNQPIMNKILLFQEELVHATLAMAYSPKWLNAIKGKCGSF
jgi:hypothetical protein